MYSIQYGARNCETRVLRLLGLLELVQLVRTITSFFFFQTISVVDPTLPYLYCQARRGCEHHFRKPGGIYLLCMYLRWLCTCKSFLVYYTYRKILFLYIVCFQIGHYHHHHQRKYQHHQFSINSQSNRKKKKKITNNEPLSPPPLSLPPPPSPPRPSSPGMVCTSLIRASPKLNPCSN